MLEVVIAAGLLLVTVTAVTAAATGVSRSGRRAEDGAHADAVLGSVCARLTALPFCASTLPRAAEAEPSATDLVAAVFPNADAWSATEGARYVPSAEEGVAGGSFVTRYDQAGAVVSCVARFRGVDAESWLGPTALSGWDVTACDRLPAPVLVVDVAARAGGVTRTARVVREAGAELDLLPAPDRSVGP